MTMRRWGVAIAVAAAVIVVGVGFAAAVDRDSGHVPAGMMSGTSMGGDMMSGTSMGAGMTGDAAGMMGGVDMSAMHEQMMASMATTVPTAMLARCDKLHDQMLSVASGEAAPGNGHASHHGGTGDAG